jgi:hypothetical protein
MDKCASTKINSFYSAEHKSIIKLGPTNSKKILLFTTLAKRPKSQK